MKITRRQLRKLLLKEFKALNEARRTPKKWKFNDLVIKHGADDQGIPNLTINFGDDEWTIGPSPPSPYTYGDIITDVPGNLKSLSEMKIIRSQLRQMIKEAIEVHQVPIDLDTADTYEAYGIGYMKGTEQDPDIDDDGFSGTVELANPASDIVDDIDVEGPSTSQMPAAWRQILGNTLEEND